MATINLSSAVIEERLKSVPTIQQTASDALALAQEAFTSVSNGKSLLAAAITDKGVPTAADDTFSVMANNIANIPTGAGAGGFYYLQNTTTPHVITIDTAKEYYVTAILWRSTSYYGLGVYHIINGTMSTVTEAYSNSTYNGYTTPTLSGNALTLPRTASTSYPTHWVIAEV